MEESPADLQAIIQSKEWTPEQQIRELQRRIGILTSYLRSEVPSFTPRPTDIICAVPPKNGTTWVAHICHQIRMQGAEPGFKDQVPDVVCFIDLSMKVFQVDPHDCIQPAHPRVYVTHLPYDLLPKGGKLIYVFRDQKDVLYSLYRMVDSDAALKGRVSLPIFSHATIKGGEIEKNMKHLLKWWEHRNDADKIVLFYDDLKEDHAGSVRRIAKFMGVDCSEEVIARVVHTTSHSEMSQHASKFGTAPLPQNIIDKLGEAPVKDGTHVGRVRKDGGRSNDGKVLPPDVQTHIEQAWKEIVTAKLGFNNLKEMRDAWRKELGF